MSDNLKHSRRAAIFMLALALPSCSHFSNRYDPTENHRKVASINSSIVDIRKSQYAPKIYEYKGPLEFAPARYVAKYVIRYKLVDFIDDLNLSRSQKKRLKKHIRSKKLMGYLVPFALAMQEFYIASEGKAKKNFRNYILDQYPDKNEFPGLEHSLFKYNEENNKSSNKGGGLPKTLVSSLFKIYDVLIIQNENFSLHTHPQRTPELLEKTKPHVREAMKHFADSEDAGHGIGDAIQHILKDPHRLEGITASLIDLVFQYSYRHYQMFHRKYHRKKLLSNWLIKEASKSPKETDLWDYLRELKQTKRFGVQLVVDGLQGNLMRSLSSDRKNSNLFLNEIYKDQINYKKNKPKLDIEYKTTKKQEIGFLEHIVSNQYNDDRYLPYFKSMFNSHGRSIALNGVSTTPSISVRNIPIATTGAPVAGEGGTGLPNFHFIDRDENRPYYFFGNDALFLDKIPAKNGMKTLFQRMPHLYGISCNSTYDSGSMISFDALFNLAVGESKRDIGEILCTSEIERRANNHLKMLNKVDELLEYEGRTFPRTGTKPPFNRSFTRFKQKLRSLAEIVDETLPDYLLIYNPWPDHFAHFTGPFADEIISPTGELNRLDYWLTRLTNAYKKAGVYDNTVFAMAGDHGLAPVFYALNPEKVVLDKLIQKGFKIKIKKLSSDEGEGPKIHNQVNPESMKGYDVVIASTAGGNYMLDLFVNQNDSWEEQPILNELYDYKLISGQRINMINEFLDRLQDTLEYMAVRLGPSNQKATETILLSKKTGELQTAIIKRIGRKVFYKSEYDLVSLNILNNYLERDISTYKDLYDECVMSAIESDASSWCDEDQWRLLTSYTIKPDSVVQLSHLYDTGLAGTINLFPVKGVGYNTKVPGRHAGELFHEKDAFVGIWGRPVEAVDQIESEINGSIAPSIYEYLTGEKAIRDEDGWDYHSLIKD